MSAIEVLKREKKYMKLHCGAISNGQWIPRDLRLAFDEALLALEQKDVKDTEIRLLHKQITNYERILNGLNEWLEKEIRDCEKLENIVQLEINKDIFTIKKNVLKEVLERVGEQK